MKPLISIIVPVYKVEMYLARCIDSVLAQTDKKYRLKINMFKNVIKWESKLS